MADEKPRQKRTERLMTEAAVAATAATFALWWFLDGMAWWLYALFWLLAGGAWYQGSLELARDRKIVDGE